MFRIIDDSAGIEDALTTVSSEAALNDDLSAAPDAMRSALENIDNQPLWRAYADREKDYEDGNQLDSDVLTRQTQLGIPPAIEPLIGPTLADVYGMEKKNRTDWRVIPDGDSSNDDVAAALNFKVNQAERHSKADKACGEAYKGQVSVGVGWVEVSRESNPFKFPYRCKSIHRNEIWWDWHSRDDDLGDCRWLLRRKWTDADIAMKLFPEKAELLETVTHGWHGFDIAELDLDGGRDTGLAKGWSDERGWVREEQEWRDVSRRRICLFELWYREFEEGFVLRFSDGRVVEFDDENPLHQVAAWGGVPVESVLLPRMKLAFFAGPHLLWEGASPYPHQEFPYVPFWGMREDRTGVPYGLIRGMMFLQDEINARISKMQWLLSAKRVVRTKGAVIDEDAVFRAEVARPDADIKLNPEAMQNDGIFKIEQDNELNRQQADRLMQARDSLKRVARTSEAFAGHDKTGRQSGSAISQLVEQTVQGLADINDNFLESRALVGQLLLELILEDLQGVEETIVLDGNNITPDREITLNKMEGIDQETGLPYRSNDTQRVKLKVIMSEVPSTPSFRAQQLTALQEFGKSADEQTQRILMPHLMNLADLPQDSKKELLTALRGLNEQPSQEDIDQMIKDAVEQAKVKMQYDLKEREVAVKEELSSAQIAKLVTEAVRKDIESIYSAIQAGREIVSTPQVAEPADQVLKSAGFEDKDAAPIVAGPGGDVTSSLPPSQPDSNTSPTSPPRTALPASEEMAPEALPMPDNPGVGDSEGIEELGTQG